MSCDPVFLRQPVVQDVKAMANALLTFPINLWADTAKKIPYVLTGYVGRGAIRLKNSPVTPPIVTNFTSVTITQTALLTNVTGLLNKAGVELLLPATPYIFDMSVDNATTGDSFCVWTGILTLIPGASV